MLYTKDLILTATKKTSKVTNESFFDKADQAVQTESFRTQEGHWQTVKIPSEQKYHSMVMGGTKYRRHSFYYGKASTRLFQLLMIPLLYSIL